MNQFHYKKPFWLNFHMHLTYVHYIVVNEFIKTIKLQVVQQQILKL